MKAKFLTVVAIAVMASASISKADSYSVGSLAGQNGWSGGASAGFTNNDLGDEAVTTDAAHSGSQSWRYSAGYGSPGSGTPFSPQLSASAGLTSSGATADTLSITFWFKPVGGIGDGSSQNIYEGTVPGDDRTGSNIYLENTVSGIVLSTYEYGGGSYPTTTLATLNDTNWHQLTMTTTASGNDPSTETTTFSIDGGAPIVTTPWADLYRQARPSPYPAADSVKFANSNAGPSSTLGFYYDDLSYSVYNSTDPTNVLASYSTSFEAATPVPLPASVGIGFSMLTGFGIMFAARKRLSVKPRIA